MLDIKKIIAKILVRLSEPYIKGINITGSIPSPSPSGWKTITQTVSIPSGYEVLPNCKVVGLYTNGDARSYFTDRSDVTQSGDTISFNAYLYNPANTTSLNYGGTLLLRRVGDAPIDPEPSQPFIQVKQVNLGTYTINASSVLSINSYAACVQACPAGYTYVGVTGFSTNHGSAVMVSARPVNSQYAFECRNLATSQLTNVQPSVWALYVRNSGS